MNANDVIESYVTDVAGRLPRKLRNDVALELRTLLDEELQANGKAEGRAVDAELALELVRRFGRPDDVAARYRPTLTIIDPVDGPPFLRATLIGLVIIWGVGLWKCLGPAMASGSSVLLALGQWWTTTVIPSLWWPGVLVVGFGLAAWGRRRSSRTSQWKPRGADRIRGSRAGLVMALVGIGYGLSVLLDPLWLIDAIFGGRAAPAVYDAFTYTDTFRHRHAPWLLVLALFTIALLIAVLVKGRWSAPLRRLGDALSLLLCAVLVWTVLDGPVFRAPASDRAMRFAMAATVVYTLVQLGVTAFRRVKPAPA